MVAEEVKKRAGRKKGTGVSKVVKLKKVPVEVVEVEEAEIEDAVVWINGKIREKIHGTYLEIGNYVFERFFGGDLGLVKSFNPHKESSFKKLSERGDLLISKTNLHNAVRVAIQEKSLLSTVQAPERLSFTHQVALLPVKSVAKKAELASRAIEEQLSYREFKSLVEEAREEEPHSAAGRPVLPGFLKSVSKMYKMTTNDGTLEGLSRENLAGMKADELLTLREKIRHILSTVKQVEKAVEGMITAPEE